MRRIENLMVLRATYSCHLRICVIDAPRERLEELSTELEPLTMLLEEVPHEREQLNRTIPLRVWKSEIWRKKWTDLSAHRCQKIGNIIRPSSISVLQGPARVSSVVVGVPSRTSSHGLRQKKRKHTKLHVRSVVLMDGCGKLMPHCGSTLTATCIRRIIWWTVLEEKLQQNKTSCK